jgi:septal ring factor EnvC (AmiA/AmiB activator)
MDYWFTISWSIIQPCIILDSNRALIKQLESEQGNLSQYTDQQERAVKQKAEFEAQLVTAGQTLVRMEEERVAATADKKVLEGENGIIKKDMEDIELAIQKLEQEKNQSRSYDQTPK